jgi:hypothetical protein
MPCSRCGASVDRHTQPVHWCDPARQVEYQMFALRHDIASFEARWQRHLDSATGRFELWLASRQVRDEQP